MALLNACVLVRQCHWDRIDREGLVNYERTTKSLVRPDTCESGVSMAKLASRRSPRNQDEERFHENMQCPDSVLALSALPVLLSV